MNWLQTGWKLCMSKCTCTCMHTYTNLLEKPRGLAGVEKQNEDKPVPRSLCVLTRRKALQQSISDYKQGAPAYVRMRRKDRRKNRARGEEQTGEGRDKAVKVKKEDSGISVLASLHVKTHT